MRIRMNYVIKKIDVFILCYVFVFLFHYFTNINVTFTFIVWIAIGMFGYIVFADCFKRNFKILLPILGVDIIGGIDLLINQSHSPVNVLILLVSHMLGIYLYEYRDNLEKVSKALYIMMAFMMLYTITVPKVVVNIYLNEYMTKFSDLVGGNSISIFCLLFLSIDLIYRYYSQKNINYVLIIMALVMAMIGGGTGGVLAISFLLIGMVCINWRNNKISKIKITVLIIVGIIGIFSIGYQYHLFSILTDDNSRFWIWSRYLECATNSVKEFLVGGSVNHIAFLAEQKNMHNTYLNLHYYYGLIPFVFYMALIIKTIVFNVKAKNFFMVVILMTLFVRGATDETTFCFMPIWTYAYLEMKNVQRSLR